MRSTALGWVTLVVCEDALVKYLEVYTAKCPLLSHIPSDNHCQRFTEHPSVFCLTFAYAHMYTLFSRNEIMLNIFLCDCGLFCLNIIYLGGYFLGFT